MPVDLTLPEMAENVDSARVVSVLVSVGDTVHKDQPIVEVETDKAAAEVPSTAEGVVTAVRVKQGEDVHVGDVLLSLDVGPPSKPDERPQVQAAEREKEQETPSKTQAETPSPDVGRPPAQAASSAPKAAELRPGRVDEVVPAAPSVRRLARELGLDIRRVAGTGPGGRISEDDVKHHVRELIGGAEEPATGRQMPLGPRPALPDFARWGEISREPMDGVRRKTAETVGLAWSEIPHVAQVHRADVTDLERMRKRAAAEAEAAGAKLTLTAILVRVVAAALKAHPKFNSSLDVVRQEVITKKYIHIGVAVDTDRGLLVPVLRDADHKGLLPLAAELGELAQKARGGTLSVSEMQGGTFTITNLGGFGTALFSPIVKWPEVAILGVGRAETRPVWDEEEGFLPRILLPLCLSYDHRVIDGANASRFLNSISRSLEQPLLLALQA